MNNYSQEQIFIFFFIIGTIIGILFSFFKSIRKNFFTTDLITFIQDLIFIIISSILLIISIIKLNNGEIRFYLFLGTALGILIYTLTIGNLCDIIFNTFIKVLKKVVYISFLGIFKLIKHLKNFKLKDS